MSGEKKKVFLPTDSGSKMENVSLFYNSQPNFGDFGVWLNIITKMFRGNERHW